MKLDIKQEWKTTDVTDLCREILADNYSLAPILADALMDAGCIEGRILSLLKVPLQYISDKTDQWRTDAWVQRVQSLIMLLTDVIVISRTAIEGGYWRVHNLTQLEYRYIHDGGPVVYRIGERWRIRKGWRVVDQQEPDGRFHVRCPSKELFARILTEYAKQKEKAK